MKTKLCTKYINAVSIDRVLKFLCDGDLQHIVAVGFFCLTWPISLCLDSFLCMYYHCILYECVG